MRIAMFYPVMDATNAHGKMDLRIMQELAGEHEITVFSSSFDNPDPERIRYVRVPLIRRPLLAQYLAFQVMASAMYGLQRLRGRSYDVVHFHDVDLLIGDVSYNQFCNTAYLRQMKPGGRRTLRDRARSIDHRIRARLEPLVLGRASKIVVPTVGLRDELVEIFGDRVDGKITVIPNFVSIDRYRPPSDEPGAAIRDELGIPDDAMVGIFIALGHYERKGLGELIEAFGDVADPDLHLLLVGGTQANLAPYLARAEELGVRERIHTVETTPDVRPYLWASDLLAFPTRYETFSLVAYEAAAAGLPLVATPVHGIVDIIDDGTNGWVVRPDPESIAVALRRCLEDPARLREMGRAAAEQVVEFGPDRFDAAWADFYATDGAGAH